MKKKNYSGTYHLFRLFLRRDRFLLPIWSLLPLLSIISIGGATLAIGDIEQYLSEMLESALISGIHGPPMGMDLGSAVIWRVAGQIMLILGIGSILTVIRHTRSEEESGRSEMVLSKPVGRHAIMSAAFLMTSANSFAAGALAAIGLIAFGTQISGAILYGLTITLIGCFFSAIAVLGAQLFRSTGQARGWALSVLGLAFILGAVNNAQGGYSFFRWLTPMAWHRLTQPFADNNIFGLLVPLLLSIIPVAIAFRLLMQRDVGDGYLQTKSTSAEQGIDSLFKLHWFQHKRTFVAWATGTLFFGIGMGGIAPVLIDSEGISDMLSAISGNQLQWLENVGMEYAFMSIIIYFVLVGVGAAYAINTVFHLLNEEKNNRAEMVLTAPVTRFEWMGKQLIIAFMGVTAICVLIGLGSGMIYGLQMSDSYTIFKTMMMMSAAKIPGLFVIAGLATLAYGFLPRIASILTWGLFIVFMTMELAWENGFIGWTAMQYSPFTYSHYTMPVNDVSWFSLLMLIILATVLTVAGLWSFSKRDAVSN